MTKKQGAPPTRHRVLVRSAYSMFRVDVGRMFKVDTSVSPHDTDEQPLCGVGVVNLNKRLSSRC
jgi:hypothetical protein